MREGDVGLEAGVTTQAAWMPEPTQAAAKPSSAEPAHARLRAWLLRCECLAGPPEAEKVPFGESPAEPLFPAASERLLAPVDRLVAWFARRSRANCSSADRQAESCSEEGWEDHELRCRRGLQISFVIVAALVLVLANWAQHFAASTNLGEPTKLGCGSYLGKYDTTFGANKCGLDGLACEPGGWFAVRCSGFCAERQTTPLAVPVVGSGPYRADSRICPAAVHAGLVGAGGGCMQARIGGPASSFEGSVRNGVTSIDFDSWYPLTLELRACSSSSLCSYGAWWVLLVLNVVLLFLLSLLRPGRRLYFWSLLSALYWYIALDAGVTYISVEDVFIRMGSYAFFSVSSYVLLWKIGGAKLFFSDTASGAPFDVLLLEILPALPLLHMPLISLITGDYDVNGTLAQDWRPAVLYGLVSLLLLPAVCVVMRQWYKAKCLRWLLTVIFCGALGIVTLSLIFSTVDWGPHFHHYFIALIGYLFARGRTRTATVFRALCLSAFIDGLCRWGRPQDIPIWGEGYGWLPDEGEVDAHARAASRAARVVWTGVLLGAGGHEVSLSWDLLGNLLKNCSNDTDQWDSDSLAAPLYVVEMNHVEVYRGLANSWTFSLPPVVVERNASGRVFFRAGTLDRGSRAGASSASKVLALRPAWPPVEVYYPPGANVCERTDVLQDQPPSTLEGFF